jgi:hypothetical protein
MLSASDVELSGIVGNLALLEVEAGYVVPTKVGLEKSLLDAHMSLRRYLKANGFHDFDQQGQGPEEKIILPSNILTPQGWMPSKVSLYRPNTKSGDPRIWISKLNQVARPENLLVLLVCEGTLFVVNASRRELWSTRDLAGSPLCLVLEKIAAIRRAPELELLAKLRNLSSLGFIDSTTFSDNGVGDTLEAHLGIKRNSSKNPDYKGIELKGARISQKTGKSTNKSGLFSRAPNWEASVLKNSREILDRSGYINDSGLKALQVTLSNRTNAQGIYLLRSDSGEDIDVLIEREPNPEKTVVWSLSDLQEQLEEKHKSTFWVKAYNRFVNGFEQFHYVSAVTTSGPLVHNFGPLVDTGKITVDYTFSEKRRGSGQLYVRDHGYLWKMRPADLDLLFPEPRLVSILPDDFDR